MPARLNKRFDVIVYRASLIKKLGKGVAGQRGGTGKKWGQL